MPVREIATAFGSDVAWDSSTRAVNITSKNATTAPPSNTVAPPTSNSSDEWVACTSNGLDLRSGTIFTRDFDLLNYGSSSFENGLTASPGSGLFAYLNGLNYEKIKLKVY